MLKLYVRFVYLPREKGRSVPAVERPSPRLRLRCKECKPSPINKKQIFFLNKHCKCVIRGLIPNNLDLDLFCQGYDLVNVIILSNIQEILYNNICSRSQGCQYHFNSNILMQ